MADFWNECFNPAMGLSPESFTSAFCNRCMNLECSRSAAQGTRWQRRVATQEDRLLNHPQFADPNDPRWRGVQQEFKNLLRQAISIEISTRQGDWSVPSEQQVAVEAARLVEATRGFVPEPAPEPLQPPVEPEPPVEPAPQPEPPVEPQNESWTVSGPNSGKYVVTRSPKDEWTCTCPAFKFSKTSPQGCKHIEEIKVLSPEPAASEPPQPPLPTKFAQTKAPAQQPQRNVPMPTGGILIGGGDPPPPPAQANPWALPPGSTPALRGTVVPVGSKVKMGKK
jgi:hypothetical protein